MARQRRRQIRARRRWRPCPRRPGRDVGKRPSGAFPPSKLAPLFSFGLSARGPSARGASRAHAGGERCESARAARRPTGRSRGKGRERTAAVRARSQCARSMVDLTRQLAGQRRLRQGLGRGSRRTLLGRAPNDSLAVAACQKRAKITPAVKGALDIPMTRDTAYARQGGALILLGKST